MAVATPLVQPNSIDRLLLAIEAEECRRSLKTFLKSIWHIVEPKPFIDGWVLDVLVDHFAALARGDIRKILVNIPPRHTKSLFLVAFRAWLWTLNPQERILAASYNLDLSLRDNVRVRRIIEDPWYQARYGESVQMRPDQNAKFYYENTASGYQMSLSVDGGTTGHGGSYLIIDDAHNATEAYSEVERRAAQIWFREVWTNRLNDQEKDKMIVVGQRIHDDDICGYIIRERPDWVHLNLPAEYEPSRKCITPLWKDPRTVEGELLWPQRFSQETLEGLKRDLGTNGYHAQYQQSPVPASGGKVKREWLRYFQETDDAYILEKSDGVQSILKSSCWTFATVDLAISSKQDADFTVFGFWAVTPSHDLILFDLVRAHFDNPEQQRQLELLYRRYQPDFIQIEAVAYQLSLVQTLLARGIPCREYRPVKDKVSRFTTASIWYENGKIFHPRIAPWLADAEMELLTFPMAAHDDVCDVVSMAAEVIVTPRIPLSGEPEPEAPKPPPTLQEIMASNPFEWASQHLGGEWS